MRALIRRASVSTSTFYKHFGSVEECFAAIVGMTIRSLVGQVRGGRRPDDDTLGGLRAAVRYLMESMAREPQMARAVFVETFAAVPRVCGEMDAALGEFEELLAEALALAPRPAVGTRHLAVGLVAGVVRIVRIRKDAGLSRSEFDRHFRGVEDCFLDAVEAISELAANAAELAAAGTASWERQIYKTMTALCTLAAADRALSRLVLLDITAPGRTGLLRREELIGRCVPHSRRGAAGEAPHGARRRRLDRRDLADRRNRSRRRAHRPAPPRRPGLRLHAARFPPPPGPRRRLAATSPAGRSCARSARRRAARRRRARGDPATGPARAGRPAASGGGRCSIP